MKILILLFTLLAILGKPNRAVLGVFYVDWSERLLATRAWLKDINLQISNPGNYQRLTGMLNYLFSGMNPLTINAIMRDNSGNSLYRPVDIRYIPHKGQGNLITNDASGNCNSVAQRRDKIQTVQPTLYAEDKFTIDEDYVRQNAENGADLQARLNKEFGDSMRVVRESINQQLVAKAAGLFGSNPAKGVGAGNYTTVTMTQAASGAIDDNFWDELKNDQEDNFQQGEIGIIGKGQNADGGPRKYMNRLAVGGLNDNGVKYEEVARDFGMALFKDSDTEAALGDANNALAIYPGNTQFFQYNLYRGDFVQDFGDRIKGTMPDPLYPINYDYILEYDKNCTTGNGLQGGWTGRVLAYFDLWTVNEDAFGDVYGDLNDFNGVLGYTFNES